MPDCMKNRLMLLIIWLAVLFPAGAQSYMFKHLEVRDGLSNNQVNGIYKDADGFMWFATASGLNRYDGYDIKVYHSEPGDSTSLPDNFIASIQEDGEGCLWIQTGGGYARYNPATETFDRGVDAWMRRIGIEGVPSLLYIDSDKTFWIYLADAGRLYRYMPGGEAATLVPTAFDRREGRVLSAFSEHAGRLLMADDTGVLYSLDKQSLQLQWTETGFREWMGNGRMPVYSLYAGRSGRVWIYCERGMGCYNLRQGCWEQLSRADEPFDAIRAVLEDKDGRVWLGKDRKALKSSTGKGVPPACPTIRRMCVPCPTIRSMLSMRTRTALSGLGPIRKEFPIIMRAPSSLAWPRWAISIASKTAVTVPSGWAPMARG